mgnify:CR=1 FL=1
MSSTVSFVQRIDAGLSPRARVASVSSTAPTTAAFTAPCSEAFAGVSSVSGNPTNGHMNTGWLGGFAETGCAKTAYVTKRISTGSLFEVST